MNLVPYGLTAPFADALMQRVGLRRVTTVALLLVAAGSNLSVFVRAAGQLPLPGGALVGLGTGSKALVRRGGPAPGHGPSGQSPGPVRPCAATTNGLIGTCTDAWFGGAALCAVAAVLSRGLRRPPDEAGPPPRAPVARAETVADLTPYERPGRARRPVRERARRGGRCLHSPWSSAKHVLALGT